MELIITAIITFILGIITGFFIYRNNQDDITPILDEVSKKYEKIEERLEKKLEELKTEAKKNNK